MSRFVRWVYESQLNDSEIVLFPEDPDRLIREFVEGLKAQGYAPRTINSYLAALSSFLGFIGLAAPSGAWQQDEAQNTPRTLSNEEQCRLLSAAKARGGPRDCAVVALGLFAGLRLAELAALEVGDVELSDTQGHIAVGHRSGDGRQVVPLNAQARAELDGWLIERSTWSGADGVALWLSRRGRRLSVRAIDLVVRSSGAAAGLEVSTRVLRHSFVTNLFRAGADIAVVAELAGHRRLETTRRYRPVTIRSGAAAVEAASVHYQT